MSATSRPASTVPGTTPKRSFFPQRQQARSERRRALARVPLALEPLEDRRLLSTFTWTGTDSNDFNDSNNWVDQNNQPGIPGPSDDAVIDTGLAQLAQSASLAGLSVGFGAEFDVTSGTFTLTGSGTINAGGTLGIETGATIDNSGTLTFVGGTVGGQDFTGNFTGGGTLNNSGTLAKTGPVQADATSITVNDLEGRINVSGAGGLNIRGGVSQGGNYTVATGSSLEISGGSDRTISGTFTGSGGGTVTINDADHNLFVANAGATFDFPAGMLQIVGAAVAPATNGASPTLANTGFMTVLSNGNLTVAGGTFQNKGTLTLASQSLANTQTGAAFDNTATGTIVFPDNFNFSVSGTLQNEGTLTIPSGSNANFVTNASSTVSNSGTISVPATTALNGTWDNSGTLDVAAGAGKSTPLANTLNNTGTIDVQSGTLDLSNTTVTQETLLADNTSIDLIGGTWELDNGATLLAASSPEVITENGGTVILNGANSSFPALSALASNSGTLTLEGGASFRTAGDLSNSGTLNLGPASTLTVSNNYTQTGAGKTAFVLGGRPTSGQFGHLATTNSATLGGTVAAQTASGFTPTFGDRYTAITSGGFTGTPAFSGGPTYSAQYTGIDGIISVTTPVTVSVSPQPANPIFGQQVTLTATVTPTVQDGTPTGTVTFLDGNTTLATESLGQNDQATFQTTAFALGAHSITVEYSGDAFFQANTSSPLSLTISAPPAGIQLIPSAATEPLGGSVTFTATVTEPAGSTPAPTGTVAFKNGSTTLATEPLQSNGQAVFTSATLPVANYSITAVYSGDANYQGLTSSAVSFGVTQGTPVIQLLSSGDPIPVGQSVTFTATVSAPAGITTAPTGNVTFKNGTTTLGSAPIGVNGQADFPTSALPLGDDSITAVYSGDTNYAGITSSALMQTIEATPVTLTLAGQVPTTSNAFDVAVSGNLAYVAETSGIDVVNISTPTNPTIVNTFGQGDITLGGEAVAVISGNTLYVADQLSNSSPGIQLLIYSLAPDPIHPTLTSSTTINVAFATGIYVQGHDLFLPTYGNYYVNNAFNDQFGSFISVDVSNPGSPQLSGELFNQGSSPYLGLTNQDGAVAVNSQLAYVASTTSTGGIPSGQSTTDGEGRILIVNTSSPANLQLSSPVGQLLIPGTSRILGVAIEGNRALLTGTTEGYNANGTLQGNLTLTVLDITDPLNPSILNTITASNTPASDVVDYYSVTPVDLGGDQFAISDTALNGNPVILVADISDPGNIQTSTIALSANVVRMQVAGNELLVVTKDALSVYNLSTPSALPTPTVTLGSSPPSTTFGQSVTFTATVTPPSGDNTAPTGNVLFMNGSTTLGSGTVGANDQATFTTSALAVGSYSVTAVYAGDTNYLGITSSASPFTVTKAPTNIQLVPSASTDPYGSSVTFTATVNGPTGVTPTPGGTVTFMNGSTALGSETIGANNQATFSTSTLAVGSYSVTAVYSGDTNFQTVTSSATPFTVNKAAATIQLTSSASTKSTGVPITFTATVAGPSGVTPAPTGMVTFLNGSTTLGSGTIGSNGQATFTTSMLAVGSYSVTAQYSGDGDYSGVTSASTPLSIIAPLQVTSVSPSSNFMTSLPNNQVVVTLDRTIAGLLPDLSDGSGFRSNPFAMMLIPSGPDGLLNAEQTGNLWTAPKGVDSGDLPVPATLIYHVNSNGTSTITLIPREPLTTNVYLISVNSLFDSNGDPLFSGGAAGVYYTSFEYLPPSGVTAPLKVVSVTADNGSVTINNNQIPQPDTIGVQFNKPLNAYTVSTSTVQLFGQGSTSALPAAVAYSPATNTAYLTPETMLKPGTVYYVAVNGVSDDAKFPALDNAPGGALSGFSTSFTVNAAGTGGPGSAPLSILATNPPNNQIFSKPFGYAAVTFNEALSTTLSQSILSRFSAMLISHTGGVTTGTSGYADVPLNAKLAFNPNTDQLIMVPTGNVLNNTIYLYSLHGITTTNGEALPGTSYATFLLQNAVAPFVTARSSESAADMTVASTAQAVVPASPASQAKPAAVLTTVSSNVALERPRQASGLAGGRLPACPLSSFERRSHRSW